MKTTIAILSVASVSLLGAPAAALATGQTQPAIHCAPTKDKVFEVLSAHHSGNKVKASGYKGKFHPCGEDDGYYTFSHHTSTLTLTKSTVVKVLTETGDPDSGKVVKTSRFPHWAKKNADQANYTFTGPGRSVKKLTERFHS
jgi:hypothetical protein